MRRLRSGQKKVRESWGTWVREVLLSSIVKQMTAAAIFMGVLLSTFLRCSPGRENSAEFSPDEGEETTVKFAQVDDEEARLSGPSAFREMMENLAPLSGLPKTSGSLQLKGEKLSLDPEFCLGLRYGECLTLIVRVPAAEMQMSTGLSMLNLLSQARSFEDILQRTCDQGLERAVEALTSWAPGRKRVLQMVKKYRCVYQSLTSEASELPDLRRNEIGLSVRLVDFSLLSEQVSTAPAFGHVSFLGNRIVLRFQDPYAFGQGAWTPLKGGFNLWNALNVTGVFGTVEAEIHFNQKLDFALDVEQSLAILGEALEPVLERASRAFESEQSFGRFLGEIAVIKESIKLLFTQAHPVVPTVIVIAAAAKALQEICAMESSDCRLDAESLGLTAEIAENFGTATLLPSSTRAALADGLKNVPYAVLEGLFKNVDFDEMERSFGLPTMPGRLVQ